MNEQNKSSEPMSVIEEALLKNISGGAATAQGELGNRVRPIEECTGK